MRKKVRGPLRLCLSCSTVMLILAFSSWAQESSGPQSGAPSPVAPAAPAPASAVSQPPASSGKIVVPAGTRFAVILENGISTRSAKPGDSVYLRTSFPITQDNKVVVPVGSYLRGE